MSKRLKELGVKQESLFYWGEDADGVARLYYDGDNKMTAYSFWLSAFTVAELGEIRPDELFDEEDIAYTLTTIKCDSAAKYWTVFYHVEERGNLASSEADTEADARAKMLVYLIEQGLYQPPHTGE